MVTRVMSNEMKEIGKAIFQCAKKICPEIEATEFDHMVALFYLYKSILRDHRDVYYSHKGRYSEVPNSQVEGTPTCILTIGRSRELVLRLVRYVKGKSGIENKMEKVEEICQKFTLKHGSLFILHKGDEKPVLRDILGYGVVNSFFKHGVAFTNVGRDDASVAMVWRMTSRTSLVNVNTGQHFMCSSERQRDELEFAKNHNMLNEFLSSPEKKSCLMRRNKKIRDNIVGSFPFYENI